MRCFLLAILLVSCGSDPAPRRDASMASAGGLTARVVEGSCQGLGPGTDVHAGGTIQTAPAERAKVELSDGTVVLLDRESKVVLESAPRTIRVEAGGAVLDVAHHEGAPLKVKLLRTEGEVEVTGTKLAVREDEGRALVDVSRGEVRLSCPRGSEVVRAGEEGVMTPGTAPVVGPAPDLGQSIAWAEAGATDEEAGVGSLRAKDPSRANATEEPLRLAEHRVKVRVSGPIARTEIEQTFANDGEHVLEGTYRFPLPSGARIAEMAVEVDGAWREGRFVDRAVGERIWRGVQKNARMGGTLGRVNTDDILFAPGPWRDPALLAWEAGNRFSIRIHPIPAHAAKKVRLAYVETLPRSADGRRYVYPLPQGQWGAIGRAVADRVSFEIRVGGHDGTKPLRVQGPPLVARDEEGEKVLTLDAEHFTPSGNLVVETADASRSEVRTATYRVMQDLFGVVAIRPDLPRRERQEPMESIVLLDSSYSAQGETWRREVAVAQAIVRELSPEDRVTVMTCDVGCRTIGDRSQPPSADLATSIGDALFRVETGGTTDVVRAIEEGVRAAGEQTSGRKISLVYVGDGASTVGVRDAGRMGELVEHAVAGPKATVSTIAVGTAADERTLAELARRTGGVAVGYAPGDAAPSLALRLLGRLRGAALEGATIALPGAPADVAPAVLPAIRAGDEVWIGARFASAATGDVVLRGSIDGEAFEKRWPIRIEENDSAGNAFVPSMWAERRALDLAAGGDSNREAVVALGVRHGLVTPYTSLLVLDSDALADRLGLGTAITPTQWTGEGEAEMSESEPPPETGLRSRESAPAAPGAGASGVGLGDLDTLGSGGGGGSGSGFGRGASGLIGRTSMLPQVRSGTVAVEGALSRDVIRRVVMRNMNQVRFCYEQQLARRPDLAGTVTVAFQIAPTGAVQTSVLASSTLGSSDAEQCIVRSVRRWTFPTFEGGPVTVRFPFILAQTQNPNAGIVGRGGWGGPPPRWGDVEPAPRGAEGLAGATEKLRKGVETLRGKIASDPDHRANHRALARLLAKIGEITEGTAAVRAWLSRDTTDTEALTLLSDFLARAGDRDRAVRVLASVVELTPGDKAAQERLAVLYERADRTVDACAHRVAIAALSPTDDAAAAARQRCEGPSGEAPAPPQVRGELVVAATWTGGVDVDVALVSRDGTRISWMGGRRNVRASKATATNEERFGVGFLPTGWYVLEVVRADGTSGPPVDGTLSVTILGTTKRVPFRLTGGRMTAGRVGVQEGGLGFGRMGGWGQGWDSLNGLTGWGR